ncbi:ATP-binding protein [Belliella kenyensis]|uniref:ATP-binding protein n=1 Tax=Belliella kenyensis TaxID=1472724 RepID=A0ABV8EI10_9BACT|nr:AAA family ATPase [Belliella kenyensis]MCH7401377.1 AAA family ATPase [Belliella kenyensis]MDN3602820.1 AAA family ATPase [Belliella kenyensis]
MEILYQKFEILLQNTTTDFKRYLYDRVSWDSRMIGIIGPRGVGKTTLILQHIKLNLNSKNALYVSADDMYFSENKLIELADEFYKNAGEYLFIDEIHKYANWSRELKNIYDSFPSLKIVFTGSSVLDILKGSSDLSRRAIIYKLQGLSFREYLNFFHNYDFKAYSLQQIINNEVKLDKIKHPIPLFKDYLKRGYYPFGVENEMDLRLGLIIVQTLETDIPQYANLNVGTSRKLKRLLSIIAESVPFKPNMSKIAAMINVSRNSLDDYFLYMEHAGLIGQLREETGGIRGLGKVDKVYLDNVNILFNLVGNKSNIGNIRETFFYNQMRVNNEATSSKSADFVIDDYTFEVGGSNKQQKQIKKDGKSFVVKDDIEFGYLNVIPLWSFGMNY